MKEKKKTKMSEIHKLSQQPSLYNTTGNNAVLYMPLSTNTAGANTKHCKENVSGAKLNHLVRYITV